MNDSKQLELFQNAPPTASGRTAEDWGKELSIHLSRPVKLSFGSARHNVVVAKSRGAELHLRLNEHFAYAPPEVGAALVSWLKNGKRARRASRILDDWIEELNQRLGKQERRATNIRQAGKVHQLGPLGLEVVQECFTAELTHLPEHQEAWHKRITWGRRGSRHPKRSIQLGSYDPEQLLIRIHPVLDQEFVPRFFLRYVLFHELLHAALDKRLPKSARERPHPPAFRRRERAYPEFQIAVEWQKENLRALLSSARNLGS